MDIVRENDVLERRIEGAGTMDSEWQASRLLSQLPFISVSELIDSGQRVVIVAPHPDDELLGCGGLIHLVAQQHIELLLLAVTDGDGSHPGSFVWTPEKLKQERPRETLHALRKLGVPDLPIHRLFLPDGAVAENEAQLLFALEARLQATDVVFVTWRWDGHPDHEATGRACATAAATRGAKLVEVPIWCWHWAKPDDLRIPWERARKLKLDTKILEYKRAAIGCYHSQLAPDMSIRRAPILSKHTLARLLHPYEVYFL